jgi:short-subunit dehydrogenase
MPTALITGGSSGLGAEFARQLAASGHDLILTARDEARLAAIAGELRDRYRVHVAILSADLATADGCEAIAARLRQDGPGAVDLLVNNAGIGFGTPTTRNSIDQELKLLQVNAAAKAHLTLAALPTMRARGSGAIINVSSVAALAPTWTDSGYGAAEAHVLAFTEALAYSRAVRTSGVRLMVLCPGAVKTGFNTRAGVPDSLTPGWQWITAQAVVRSALRDLRRGRIVSIPSARYKFLAFLLRHLPHRMVPLYARDYGDLPRVGQETQPSGATYGTLSGR